MVWKLTNLADWADSKINSWDESVASNLVDKNGNVPGSVVLTTGNYVVGEVAKSFVDVLRLGDGVKQGTASGVFDDAMRVLVFTPVGRMKVLQGFEKIKFAKGIKAALHVKIPSVNMSLCVPTAMAKALTMISQKKIGMIYVPVEKLMSRVGWTDIGIHESHGVKEEAMVKAFKDIGADVTSPVKADSEAQIRANFMNYNSNVAVLEVNFAKRTRRLYPQGHAVVVYKDLDGRIKIMDQNGTPHAKYTFDAFMQKIKRMGWDDVWTENMVMLKNVSIDYHAVSGTGLFIGVNAFMLSEGIK